MQPHLRITFIILSFGAKLIAIRFILQKTVKMSIGRGWETGKLIDP